ncbi:MAG: ATP/GTP-binding protein [Candidatus Bathyarchaeia archaeon]
MYLTFIIGTAGSGKSLLAASFSDWLKSKEQEVIVVNLDPGTLTLPYTPDVDVRDYISVNGLMERYKLGPNGALIMAADLIAEEAQTIREEIEAFRSDYVLVDTPGQMELFAFRASGPYIAHELTADPKAVVYLFDASFSSDPLNYVSNMFLAAAVYNRFLLPQVYILSKVDLLPPGEVDRVLDWGSRVGALEDAMERRLSEIRRLMSIGMMRVISELGLDFTLTPVSSKNMLGFIDLHATLTRIFTGGEEPE